MANVPLPGETAAILLMICDAINVAGRDTLARRANHRAIVKSSQVQSKCLRLSRRKDLSIWLAMYVVEGRADLAVALSRFRF